MERLRSIAYVPIAGVALVVALAGCVSPRKMPETVSRTVEKLNPWSPPSPATQVVCFWHRQLTPLPNPAKDGILTPGLAGQVFLITNESNPAEVNGDVTIAVYDDTPRTGGAAAKTPEVWHFTQETLKKLATTDERFGRSYVLFLPWPTEWQDVTTIRILARYDPVGGTTLHASEVRVVLDTSNGGGPVWSEAGKNGPPSGASAFNVPSGAKVVEQVRSTSTVGAPSMIVPAGGFPK